MHMTARTFFAASGMLTLWALGNSFFPGVVSADTSDRPPVTSFIEHLIGGIKSDGRFASSDFNCQLLHVSNNGGSLLECVDKHTRVGSLWANNRDVENVAVSIVFAQSTLGGQRTFSPVGDLVVKNQNDLDQIRSNFEMLKDGGHLASLEKCNPPTELASTAAQDALIIEVRNPVKESRITLLFTGSKQNLLESSEKAQFITDGEIVSSIMVINRLNDLCDQ